MRLSIISSSEKQLLKKIEETNDPDVAVWRINNIWVPGMTICIALIAFALFKPNENPNTGENIKTFIAYVNLILNGSIPMIALTRIGSTGMYLFKYDKAKEKKYGIADTYYLRTKLFSFFLLILVGTIFLYVFQVLNNPFDYSWRLLITFGFSLLSVFLAINVSKNVFLLQEKMIDVTFEQEIRDDMEEKGHGKKW